MDSTNAIKLLIHLINVANKRGAFNLEESTLGFFAINTLIENPRFEEIKKIVTDNVIDTNSVLKKEDDTK
jgi:hypothetical protein